MWLADFPYFKEICEDFSPNRNRAHFFQIHSAMMATGIYATCIVCYGSDDTKTFVKRIQLYLVTTT